MAKLPRTSVDQHFTQYFIQGAQSTLLHGQLCGLWQYLRYFSCADKMQVSLCHFCHYFLSSGLCFLYGSWTLFCFLLALDLKDVCGLSHGYKRGSGFEFIDWVRVESYRPALVLSQQVTEN